MIRVVIADDHTILREGLRQLLGAAADIEVVAEAARRPRGDRAGARARRSTCCCSTCRCPARAASSSSSRSRPRSRSCACSCFSMHEEQQYAVRAIKAGASGYVTKDSAGTQLVTAIRKVAGGGAFITAEVAEQLALGAMPEAEGAAARAAVGPRVRSLPAAGGGRHGDGYRGHAQSVGQDREHAQGAAHGKARHRQPGRPRCATAMRARPCRGSTLPPAHPGSP